MRIILTRKDIQLIKGCSEKTAQKIYNTVKDCLGKGKRQSLSIKEYCGYEGLDLEEVREMLKG